MDFTTSALAVLSLLLLALPGFLLIKSKLISSKAIGYLVTVLLYVNQPFIILNSFLSKEFESRLLVNMGIVLAVAMLAQLLIMLIAKLIFLADKNVPRRNAYTFASALGNVLFMGVPVVSAMLPNNAEAILYLTVFSTTFNLIGYTLGIYVLTGDKKFMSIKKALLNPPMIAMIIALPLFFLKVKMPITLMRPIGFLSDMNTPLAMIVLGMRFAEVQFKELFVGWGMFLASFIKLVVFPLMIYGILYPIAAVPYTVRIVLVMAAAMPSANLVLMLSEKFGGDPVAAVKVLMNSTLLSMLTIPLIMLLPMGG